MCLGTQRVFVCVGFCVCFYVSQRANGWGCVSVCVCVLGCNFPTGLVFHHHNLGLNSHTSTQRQTQSTTACSGALSWPRGQLSKIWLVLLPLLVDAITAELLSKNHHFPVTMYLDKKKINLCKLKYFIIVYNEQQMASILYGFLFIPCQCRIALFTYWAIADHVGPYYIYILCICTLWNCTVDWGCNLVVLQQWQ